MHLIQQALIVVYTCVLVVKACYVSEDVCELFGFGRRANGESKGQSARPLPSQAPLRTSAASDVGSSRPFVSSRHLPVLHLLCTRHALTTPGGLNHAALLHGQRAENIFG